MESAFKSLKAHASDSAMGSGLSKLEGGAEEVVKATEELETQEDPANAGPPVSAPGTSENVEKSSLAPDPDFADELAELEELERSGELSLSSEDEFAGALRLSPTASERECLDGTSSDLKLCLDSDTESKSISSKKSNPVPDDMDEISSQDMDDYDNFEEKRRNRLSTESISSHEDNLNKGEMDEMETDATAATDNRRLRKINILKDIVEVDDEIVDMPQLELDDSLQTIDDCYSEEEPGSAKESQRPSSVELLSEERGASVVDDTMEVDPMSEKTSILEETPTKEVSLTKKNLQVKDSKSVQAEIIEGQENKLDGDLKEEGDDKETSEVAREAVDKSIDENKVESESRGIEEEPIPNMEKDSKIEEPAEFEEVEKNVIKVVEELPEKLEEGTKVVEEKLAKRAEKEEIKITEEGTTETQDKENRPEDEDPEQCTVAEEPTKDSEKESRAVQDVQLKSVSDLDPKISSANPNDDSEKDFIIDPEILPADESEKPSEGKLLNTGLELLNEEVKMDSRTPSEGDKTEPSTTVPQSEEESPEDVLIPSELDLQDDEIMDIDQILDDREILSSDKDDSPQKVQEDEKPSSEPASSQRGKISEMDTIDLLDDSNDEEEEVEKGKQKAEEEEQKKREPNPTRLNIMKTVLSTAMRLQSGGDRSFSRPDKADSLKPFVVPKSLKEVFEIMDDSSDVEDKDGEEVSEKEAEADQVPLDERPMIVIPLSSLAEGAKDEGNDNESPRESESPNQTEGTDSVSHQSVNPSEDPHQPEPPKPCEEENSHSNHASPLAAIMEDYNSDSRDSKSQDKRSSSDLDGQCNGEEGKRSSGIKFSAFLIDADIDAEDTSSNHSAGGHFKYDDHQLESEQDGEGGEKRFSLDHAVLKTTKKRISSQCINPKCLQQTTELFQAPHFVRRLFKLKENIKKVKICGVCLQDYYLDRQAIRQKFKDSALGYDDMVTQMNLEIIDSTDEEDQAEEEKKIEEHENGSEEGGEKQSSEEFFHFLEENLANVIVEMDAKYDLAKVAAAFEDSCTRRLKEQTDEIDSMLHAMDELIAKNDHYYNQLMVEHFPVHQCLVTVFRPPNRVQADARLLPENRCLAQWIPGVYQAAWYHSTTVDARGNLLYEISFIADPEARKQVRPDQLALYRKQSIQKFGFGSRIVAIDSAASSMEMTAYAGMVMDVLRDRLLIFFESGLVRYIRRDQVRECLTAFPSCRNMCIVMERHSKHLIRELIEKARTREFQFEVGDAVEVFMLSKWRSAAVLQTDEAVVVCRDEEGTERAFYTGSPYIQPVGSTKVTTKYINATGPNVVVKTEMYVPQYGRETAAVGEGQESEMILLENRKRRVQPQRTVQQKEGPTAAAVPISPPSRAQPPLPPQQQQQLTRQPAPQLQKTYPAHPSNKTVAPPTQVAKKSTAAAGLSTPPERTGSSRPRQAQTTTPRRSVKNMNNATIYLDDDDVSKGQVVSFVAPRKFSKTYTPHNCSRLCKPEVTADLSKYNPLAQPLMAGWRRRLATTNTKQRMILYKAPCGRSLRNMNEIHYYLRETRSPFNVDLFEFEVGVQCLSEYRVDQKAVKLYVEDLSVGKEPMPVSCVNYYDDTLPPKCSYSTERIPTEGVQLNLDQDFLACCDCEDDCLNKAKCQCWQLTIQGEKMRDKNIHYNDVGYVYKRLPDPVPTGIYECNPRCRCSKNCLNRVVQHKIQLKLQVFKTANRGWGIRCLNDVPKGGFICVYAGHLLTEQKANEAGENDGDEYFAELDYIEVAERLKTGYESDLPEDWHSDFDSSSTDSSDDLNVDDEDFTSSRSVSYMNDRKRLTRQQSNIPSKKSKPMPLRKLFGRNEDIYVMDAKIAGNIGRYFNHSCAPNLFVQNVFVDTHDLRFPWVSFFALHNIRAGTELTWNYNYELGSVQGKILICQCGAETCRGRLL